MIKETTFKRYVLLDEQGTSAENYHQDDSCDPIVADTISGLISLAAEWADVSEETFVQWMEQGEQYAEYTIACEEGIVRYLTPAEIGQVAQIWRRP